MFDFSFQKISLIAAIALPFCNLPLILRIIRRRSSGDISALWAIGVWFCLLLMAPTAFVSEDVVWRVFSIINFVLFSCVLVTVLTYYKRKNLRREEADAEDGEKFFKK